jgi:RsiW-degrading membrane proteinase PrsW (M82 family)
VDAEQEWELKMAVMQAELENKRADTAYKNGLLKYEPWKVVLASFLSGAAVLGAIVGLLTAILK